MFFSGGRSQRRKVLRPFLMPARLPSLRGGKPRSRRHCRYSLTLLRGLKGMRACLAAARLRLYPDYAAAAAPPGRARSAGGAAAPPGRPSLRVARRSGFAAAALRSGRGRRSAPRLRPSAPARRLRGSRLCPRARWAALSLSPVAPCSRLRSRGGAARPLGRSLRSRPAAAWWAFRPPAFGPGFRPLRRAGFRRCGARRKPALRPAFRG